MCNINAKFLERRILGVVKVAFEGQAVRAYFPELGIVAPGGERCTREVQSVGRILDSAKDATHGAYASTLYGCPCGAQAPVVD